MMRFTVYRELPVGLRVHYQLGPEGGVSFPRSDEDAIEYICSAIRDRKADRAEIDTLHSPSEIPWNVLPYPALDLQVMRELVAEQSGIPVE
ncbi:MAG: hypothetical protein HYW25_00745 [Candidatus Aenigmarchaeota archaeon]|nr:hypothetical protein [Candidatus Aenigmarchaeota archaeon]